MFWVLLLFRFGIFFGSVALPVFLSIYSILELEAAISTVFVTFWNWMFSMFDGICNIVARNMVVCKWSSSRVGFQVGLGVLSGF